MKSIIISLFIFFQLNIGMAQSTTEIYAGPSICNVMRTRHGQQILYGHVENAPLWNIGFQVGVNKTFKLSAPISLQLGIRAQLRGDRKGIHEVLPIRDTLDLRMIYLLFPVNLKWQLLNDHKIFFQFGVSPDFMIYQTELNNIPFFANENELLNRFGLTGQAGFAFQLGKSLTFETMYSQSLISFYNISLESFPDNSIIRHFHQAFEFTLNYLIK